MTVCSTAGAEVVAAVVILWFVVQGQIVLAVVAEVILAQVSNVPASHTRRRKDVPSLPASRLVPASRLPCRHPICCWGPGRAAGAGEPTW